MPPHTDVTVEITVDQPLAWLPRRAGSTASRPSPRPATWADPVASTTPHASRCRSRPRDLPARLKLAFTVRGEALADATPESPSHAIRVETQEDGFAVSLAAASGVALDRDVVLRWAAAGREPGVRLEVARPPAGHALADSAFGLLTIVPPAPDAPRALVARDLIVLLDVSGSMLGEPLDQAVALVEAMVDALGEPDTLEMIAFAMRAERWRSAPARMERATRASGAAPGAEPQRGRWHRDGRGLREALAPLRPDAQRQVVLVTDGLIGFEDEAVREVIDHLPAGSRVHVVGVGSAVNRGLTQPLARAGRGAELVVGIDEPVAVAAGRLVALTSAPLAVDLEVGGPAVRGTAPRRLPDVMAGTPCMAAVALDPAGGDLVVRGRLGNEVWERHVEVSAVECGVGSSAVLARWAREAVADAEMRFAGGSREEEEVIERLGLDFGIATRRTSWVAISDEATVDPTQPTRRVEMPQMLPLGLSAFGLGLTEELSESFGECRDVGDRGGRDATVPTGSARAPVSVAGLGVETAGRHVGQATPPARRPDRARHPIAPGGRVRHRDDRARVAARRGGDAGPASSARRARGADHDRGEHRTGPDRARPHGAPRPAARPCAARPDRVGHDRAGWRAAPHRCDRGRVSADLDEYAAAIGAGDLDAFGRWVAGAEPVVRGSLRSFAARVDAEAVVQETLFRVWQVARRFVADDRPNGLVRLALRIARNLALDEMRRLRTMPADPATIARLGGRSRRRPVQPVEPDPRAASGDRGLPPAASATSRGRHRGAHRRRRRPSPTACWRPRSTCSSTRFCRTSRGRGSCFSRASRRAACA